MAPDLGLLRRVPALRAYLAVCLAAAAATAVAVLLQAEAIATGLSRMATGDVDAVGPLVTVLVVLGTIRGVAKWAIERSATSAIAATRRSVAATVLRKLDALDDPSRSRIRPATVTSLATKGVDELEPWIRGYLPALCLAALVPLAAGLRILFADVVSAVILLISIPLIPVFMVLIGHLTQGRSQRQWATLQRLSAHFHDTLVGLQTLRLFGRAEAQIDRVRSVTNDYRRAVMETLRVAFLSAFVLELLATLSVALVAVTAGVRLADGSITLRTALVVLLLAPECSLPLRRLGAAFHAATAGTDAAAELDAFDALAEVAEGSARAPTTEGATTDTSRTTLVVNGAVVEDETRGRRVGPIDLIADRGEVLALVGPSGSGKSTLLSALAAEVPLSQGQITLNDSDIGAFTRIARRSSVVVIAQHPMPLGATVDESVALGATGTSAEARCAALARVDLSGFESRRPEDLSGGELQRLAIARALLAAATRPVSVVAADEPTAHLDEERATLVANAFAKLAATGVAVVIATHDPIVMARSDRIHSLIAPPPSAQGAAHPATEHAAAPQPTRKEFDSERHPPTPRLLPEPVAGDSSTAKTGGGIAPGIRDLQWFRRLAPAHRGELAGARALGVAADACAVGLVAAAAWLILRSAQHPSFADLAVVAVAVRAFGLGKGALRYAERLASHDVTLRQLGEIRAAVVGRLGRLVPAGLPNTSRGELMTAVVDDVDRLGDFELRIFGPAISALTVAGAAVFGLWFVDPAAAAVLATGVVLSGVVLPALAAARALRTSSQLVSAKAEVTSSLLSLAERSAELARLGASAEFEPAVVNATDRVVRLERLRGRTGAAASGIAAALGPWTAAGIAGLIGAANGSLTGPELGIAMLTPLAVMELLAPATAGAELIASVAGSASRLRELLQRPDPAHEPSHPTTLSAAADLDLSAVAFRWPDGPDVVTDLNVGLAEGGRLLVRGRSGSGKSTLAAGLVAFLNPSEGTYSLGGVDTAELRGAQVRQRVTWCSQEPWLADTSIRENLRIASPEATDEELWSALQMMRLDAWVHALPKGLDTFLGRGGATASGGQRQRLAVARVVLSGHRVVVLDEPTAHLDEATGSAMLRDLWEAFPSRSLIVMGHDNYDLAFDAELSVVRGSLR